MRLESGTVAEKTLEIAPKSVEKTSKKLPNDAILCHGAAQRAPLLRRVPARWLYWFTMFVGLASYGGFLFHPTTAGFGPDSWSYHDLAQTIFGDFYRPAIVRSFSQADGYSRSFPPLWPVVLGLLDQVCAAGPRLAVAAAAAAAMATILPLRQLASACIPGAAVGRWAAAGAWLGLLWFPAYWAEVRAGGTIPLAILLLTAGMASAVRGHLAGAGLLWGAVCMTRFDAAPVCALFLASFAWRYRLRPVSAGCMFLLFGLAVSPWIYYSKLRYGVLWASDNTVVATASTQVFVQDLRAPSGTLATEPARWLARVARNSMKLALAIVHAFSSQPLFVLAIAALFAARSGPGLSFGGPLAWFLAAALAGLAGCALTGYVDRRYFSFLTMIGALWAMGAALRSTRQLRTALAFAALLSPLAGLEWLREEFGGGQRSRRLPDSLRRELQGQSGQTVVLADSLCYETGAVTRLTSVCLPTDWGVLTTRERESFLARFGVTHAIVPDGRGYRILRGPQAELPVQDR
ncbi:MAG TPA: hypothetical protein VFQ91_10265 [Bryobacteraceae bacterium]|nr:hypothetical protein [Bryobacteraceae bacterium]